MDAQSTLIMQHILLLYRYHINGILNGLLKIFSYSVSFLFVFFKMVANNVMLCRLGLRTI